MLVYRLCKKDEICKVLTKNFLDIGKNYNVSNKNNFNYIEDIKYIHFFKNRNDIYYLNCKKDYYICTYNIPEEILTFYQGVGYYMDFINFSSLSKVSEYALPNYFLNYESLEKIELLVEDMDYDSDNVLKVVYEKSSNVKVM